MSSSPSTPTQESPSGNAQEGSSGLQNSGQQPTPQFGRNQLGADEEPSLSLSNVLTYGPENMVDEENTEDASQETASFRLVDQVVYDSNQRDAARNPVQLSVQDIPHIGDERPSSGSSVAVTIPESTRSRLADSMADLSVRSAENLNYGQAIDSERQSPEPMDSAGSDLGPPLLQLSSRYANATEVQNNRQYTRYFPCGPKEHDQTHATSNREN